MSGLTGRNRAGYINKWPFYSGPCPSLVPLSKPGYISKVSRVGWLPRRTCFISIPSLSGDWSNNAAPHSSVRPERPWSAVPPLKCSSFRLQILTDIGLVCGSQGTARCSSTTRHTSGQSRGLTPRDEARRRLGRLTWRKSLLYGRSGFVFARIP